MYCSLQDFGTIISQRLKATSPNQLGFMGNDKMHEVMGIAQVFHSSKTKNHMLLL